MQNLSPQEFQFVTELLNGSTVEQAGEAVGIKRRSAFLWKAKEHIQAALEAGVHGQVKVIEELRAERARVTLPQVSSLLEEAAPRMVEILVQLAELGNFSTRLLAAKEVIRLSGIIQNQSHTEITQCSVAQPQQGLSEEQADIIRRQILGIGVDD